MAGPLTPSRRRVLALCGASVGLGAAGGYVAGADPFVDEQPRCDPRARVADAGDWPSPRYDPAGSGSALARNAPAGDFREVWHTELIGSRISQPVVASGRVAVATAESGGNRIATLDLSSGDELWSEPISDRGEVGELVAAAGDLFYRTWTDEVGSGVVALSLADGRRRWVAPEDRRPRSRPVVTGSGHVWLTERHVEEDESSVVALSADTGDECTAWTVEGSGAAPPVFDDGRLYHGTNSGAVALDRGTGDERWRSDVTHVPRAVHDGWVYATATFGWLTAVDAGSGDVEWTVESEHYLDGEPHPDNPEVMVAEDGTSYARPDYRTLAVTDDVLLARERVWSDHADRITAFDPESGDQVWQIAPDDEWPDADDRFWYTGPSVAGGSAFVCENRRNGPSYLRRTDLESGEIRDSVEMDSYALTAPSVGSGAVLVSRGDGVACYLDRRWS